MEQHLFPKRNDRDPDNGFFQFHFKESIYHFQDRVVEPVNLMIILHTSTDIQHQNNRQRLLRRGHVFLGIKRHL